MAYVTNGAVGPARLANSVTGLCVAANIAGPMARPTSPDVAIAAKFRGAGAAGGPSTSRTGIAGAAAKTRSNSSRPSAVCATRSPRPTPAVQRSVSLPIRTTLPSSRAVGAVTSAPFTHVPFREPASEITAPPSADTSTSACMRETSASYRHTCASAARPTK